MINTIGADQFYGGKHIIIEYMPECLMILVNLFVYLDNDLRIHEHSLHLFSVL